MARGIAKKRGGIYQTRPTGDQFFGKSEIDDGSLNLWFTQTGLGSGVWVWWRRCQASTWGMVTVYTVLLSSWNGFSVSGDE